MSEPRARVYPDTYVDSVLLMGATRAMGAAAGVEWSAAVMGTPANREDLAAAGFAAAAGVGAARANDLVLAVRAATGEEAEAALGAGYAALGAAGRAGRAATEETRPADLDAALAALGEANVAIVSVPGPFAALEAHKALSAGLHVLLFSDNVPLADEVELKSRAAGLGLLVMGPGAGTAMLGGTGLGFANAVRPGRVGVVAAAGTGAQEVMCLLDRWGEGVRQAIGVGGRDLSAAVGGEMARAGLRALAADPAAEAVILVSKPPSPAIAADLLATPMGKPVVAALIGLREPLEAPAGVTLEATLEQAVVRTIEILGSPVPDPGAGLGDLVGPAIARLSPERRAVLGLFSGGTLAYESMVVMTRHLGPIRSNTPLQEGWALPAPPGAHVCLDLGEEEFTRGRPHPMIDPAARADRIAAAADDPAVGAVLIDVVLGYGSHPDPAAVLAPACAAAGRGGAVVVAYVLGTEADPQRRSAQEAALGAAGCLLAPTAARAALMAAAIAIRQPELAGSRP
ncbi:MAG TPA: protein FdrA [Actinomycetota bacterium]|nr:protein FdrA [Actinomycetota bacterium]